MVVAVEAEEVFTSKPVTEMTINELFETEYKKVMREILESFIRMAIGYFNGLANRANQLLPVEFIPSFTYSFEPDGVLFTVKYTFEPKSLEKLKKEVLEKVEKRWIRITLHEKYHKHE
jgi:hypothetical protein